MRHGPALAKRDVMARSVIVWCEFKGGGVRSCNGGGSLEWRGRQTTNIERE